LFGRSPSARKKKTGNWKGNKTRRGNLGACG